MDDRKSKLLDLTKELVNHRDTGAVLRGAVAYIAELEGRLAELTKERDEARDKLAECTYANTEHKERIHKLTEQLAHAKASPTKPVEIIEGFYEDAIVREPGQ